MAGRFSIEAIFKGSDRFTPMLGAIQARTSRFATGVGGALNSASSAVDRFGERLKAVAFGAAAVGAIAGAGLMKIGEAGAHFEQSITDVGAVMGKTRAQIGDLEKEAMRLGVVTQFSATEVSEAMEMMARKGFDSEEILQGIPGVLNAIAASGEGMAEVATVVGSSIRSFGLDASKASHVADVLAYSAEKTGAHITDMGNALAIAGPTAKTLGVSIEDTAAAVGLLQKIGLDASTAGTATATMLAKITKPSKDAAAQMAAMGISFKDAKGNMLPFRDVLGQFIKAGDKAGGNMDRMAFLAELVGLRGDKAAIGLSDMAKAGDFDKLAAGLKNVDGYAEKQAKIRLDTTRGSWKLLTSTVEVLEDRLWTMKSGPLRGVIDSTNAWLQANQELILSRTVEYIEKAGKAAEVFGGGVRDGFNALKSGLGDTEGPLGRISGVFDLLPSRKDAIRDVGIAIGSWGPIFIVAAVGVKTLAFAMGVLNGLLDVNPYLLLLGAIVALGGAFILYRPEIDAFARRHKVLLGVVAAGVTIVAGAWAWTNAWKGAVLLLEVAQNGAAAATWVANTATAAWAGATKLAGAAEVLFTGQIAATAVATDGAAASFVAADLALGPLLLTLGLVAVALGAVVYEWQQLEQMAGGHVWEGVKSFVGGKGFFKGVDDAENEDARKKYAAEHPGPGVHEPPIGPPPPPGAASPGAPGSPDAGGAPPAPLMPPQVVGGASAVDPAQLMALIEALQKQQNAKIEIDVKAADGTKADVKTPNAGKKNPIKLTNSGATQ